MEQNKSIKKTVWQIMLEDCKTKKDEDLCYVFYSHLRNYLLENNLIICIDRDSNISFKEKSDVKIEVLSEIIMEGIRQSFNNENKNRWNKTN